MLLAGPKLRCRTLTDRATLTRCGSQAGPSAAREAGKGTPDSPHVEDLGPL